jgi:hypothetical protein
MEGCHIQRPQRHSLRLSIFECANQRGWQRRLTSDTHGDETADRPTSESPHRELHSALRWPIEPLEVVDRDDERTGFGEHAKDSGKSRDERPGLWCVLAWSSQQEGNLEGAPLGDRQALIYRAFNAGKEVGEACVRQLGLRRRRSTGQDSVPLLLGQRDRLAPDRGLANTRLALQDHAGRAMRERPQEATPLLQLPLAPNHRGATTMTAKSAGSETNMSRLGARVSRISGSRLLDSK